MTADVESSENMEGGSIIGSTIEVSDHRIIEAGEEEHEGFPRMVRCQHSRLLLFTRLGRTHAYDAARIMQRTSEDGGETWSEAKEIWMDPAAWCAHNPVAVVAPDGTIVLWCSRYEYMANRRHHCVISLSTRNGERWRSFEHFDTTPDRTTYYVTDAIVMGEDMLAISTCFSATAREPAFNVVWRSEDNGRTWKEISQMTNREDNIGDEVAIAQLDDERLVVLLRGRHRKGTYRYRSDDAGQTWSAEDDISAQVGQLQRPVLTHLGGTNWLLTGRQADHNPPAIAGYVSVDNCESFSGPQVIDTYQSDGGYTTTVVRDDDTIVMAYYADTRKKDKPDIHIAELNIGRQTGED